ncbi:unnamed protein product [Rotaria sordida]|uniref:Uncharacterized protein n=1 Tax=Rotaria sordida TaxID=392033 RepID=A0A819PV95_9BILA|nr:unnamed protein product [Rotaria sordida]CAF1421553.1 unnamed protein product [Rotaria sordida]CAF1442703.1 unnamed protein product [Rotaria sordida]CAF3906894.1 unnamed protein product [Rotaria sordida]CAF4021328.1 unnamed protein product [Rotaria sordida]
MLVVRSFFIILFVTLFVGVFVLDWYLAGTIPWSHYESSIQQSINGIPFCEYDRSRSFLREKANSLPDFSFLGVGFYMLVRSIEAKSNSLTKTIILSVINGLTNCVHAFGLWLNHACRCQFGHRLDVAGMWLVTLFITLYSLMQHIRIENKKITHYLFTFMFLLIAYILWHASDVYYPESYDNREKILVIGCMIIFLISEFVYMKFSKVKKKQMKLFGFGLMMILIGGLCGHLNAAKIICWPKS